MLSIFFLPLCAILRYHSIDDHIYVDDTQLYISFKCNTPLAGSNDSRLHVVDRPEDDPSFGKLESTHPSRTSVKSDQGFLVSSQSCVSTLTHYSSELILPRHQEL